MRPPQPLKHTQNIHTTQTLHNLDIFHHIYIFIYSEKKEKITTHKAHPRTSEEEERKKIPEKKKARLASCT